MTKGYPKNLRLHDLSRVFRPGQTHRKIKAGADVALSDVHDLEVERDSTWLAAPKDFCQLANTAWRVSFERS